MTPRQHTRWSEHQRKLAQRRKEAAPGSCPATHGDHAFTTFAVHIAPRRVCLWCGHVALPGEDPADPHDASTDPPCDALGPREHPRDDGRDGGGPR